MFLSCYCFLSFFPFLFNPFLLSLFHTHTHTHTHSASTRRPRARLVSSAFAVLDSDHDGRVAAADLRHILTKIGDKLTAEEMDSAFAELGITDDSQMLGIEEFYKITGTTEL